MSLNENPCKWVDVEGVALLGDILIDGVRCDNDVFDLLDVILEFDNDNNDNRNEDILAWFEAVVIVLFCGLVSGMETEEVIWDWLELGGL